VLESPLGLPLPRFPATLLKKLHITHHHAPVYSFANILDCEQGDLDCGEKPSKNKELRKTKTT